jgi:hypothetical protein
MIIHSYMEMGMLIITQGQDFSYVWKSSSVKRAEFVSKKMSYILLRGCWCDIIVLNFHAPRINVMVQGTAFVRN